MTIRTIICVGVLSAFICGVITTAQARETAFWSHLDYGPHDIGFRTIELFDYSRTFGPKYDYFGEPLSRETARPIQIAIWYPAEKSDQAEMVYGEYVFTYPDDLRFFDFLTRLQERDNAILRGAFGGDDGLVVIAMNLVMKARREASLKEDSFPIVLYIPDRNHSIAENAALCEYLASHGFIAASSPSIGAYSLEDDVFPDDVDAFARDKELILGYLRDQKIGDIERVGVVGYGFGGLAAAMIEMRNVEIDAIASLNSPVLTRNNREQLSRIPYLHPTRLDVPCLYIAAMDEDSVDLDMLEDMKYAQRYYYQLRPATPHDLIGLGKIALFTGDEAGRENIVGTVDQNYAAMCQYVCRFFKAVLGPDEESLAFLNAGPEKQNISASVVSARVMEKQRRPPTHAEFLIIIEQKDVETIRKIRLEFELDNSSSPILSAEEINALGYRFIQQNKPLHALEILSMGPRSYPASANAWDSLGEAYVLNERFEEALECYEKAVELLPSDTITPENLKEVLRQNLPNTIEDLRTRIKSEER
jgi:tetratricopeptide (TPR) repeat protein